LDNNLIKKIEFEINEIDTLFKEYELFFADMNYEEPDLVQKTVMSNILHSFYTGLENIFKRISKDFDYINIVGEGSHRALLNNVYNRNNKREAIIDEETYNLLDEYRKFRHFFRHGYSFQLDWERIKPLSDTLFDLWEKLKEQLYTFIDSLNEKDEEENKTDN